MYDRESIYESIYVTHTHTTPADLLLLSGGDFPLSRSPPREMSYSKSSKREMELFKIQQEREMELLKIQQEREMELLKIQQETEMELLKIQQD